jgi:hypothetical protein
MRALAAVVASLALVGCAASAGPPPPSSSGAPDVFYLVHNQLWAIGLDGTHARAVASAGDDRYRAGFPRALPDGRAAVLADDTGAIYPYVVGDGGGLRRMGATNVTVWDALCGVRVGEAPALVYTVTPYVGGRAAVVRVDPAAAEGGAGRVVAFEREGLVSEPAPWDDGAVLVVRRARGKVTVEILDVGGGGSREVLATIDAPYEAHAPARLPDGRVVFVRTDPRDSTDAAVGELFVLERGGAMRTTGITGVRAAVVVGEEVVYEEGGADGVTDLIRTNLVDAPVNVTRTPYVAEHLGWSD